MYTMEKLKVQFPNVPVLTHPYRGIVNFHI